MNDKGDKYNRILKAAIEIISEKGLQKTAISDIVQKADVAQGTFYLYFSSKNALIPAIAENLLMHTLKKIKQRVSASDNFWSALQIYIDETYAITNEYKDVVVLCYSGAAFDYSMETWEKIYQPYYEWFEKILNKAINEKKILADIQVMWTSKLLINLAENAAERFYIANDQDMTCEESKNELFHFIKRSLVTH
ncbi:TetR family transcriptional regulator [Solibacillus sp. FSL H8-0538]|uniref:TetR family transcriptional regulator n=1 Tax=Solibacillus sp. FSL H8-0538 TaxID=2921400 RepID=UPI0030F554E3